MRVMLFRLVEYIVEQPLTSCVFALRCFRRLTMAQPIIQHDKTTVRLMRKFVWLGFWGHTVPKPTVLWGCSRILPQLHSVRPPVSRTTTAASASIVKATTKKIIKRGSKFMEVYRIYGVKGKLKATQAYPRRFCNEVAFRSKFTFNTL